MKRFKVCVAVAAVLTVRPILLAVPAHADGLSSCTEDSSKLHAEAEKTIELIGDKVPLGPYESANTFLQFVNESLGGIDTPMSYAQIMAMYATGRENGSINAPRGPGLS